MFHHTVKTVNQTDLNVRMSASTSWKRDGARDKSPRQEVGDGKCHAFGLRSSGAGASGDPVALSLLVLFT
jgi:hypothetical protein